MATVLLVAAFCLILAAAVAAEERQVECEGARYRDFQFYVFDDYNTSDPSVIHIAGPPFNNATLIGIPGALAVFDDLVTEGEDRSSRALGRAQGQFMNTARANNADFWTFTVYFTAGKFNGSSMSIQGLDFYYVPGRELAITGGTGGLRYASGYVNQYTIYVANGTSLFRFNGTVRTPIRTGKTHG